MDAYSDNEVVYERKLSQEIAKLRGEQAKELSSVYCCLWLQCIHANPTFCAIKNMAASSAFGAACDAVSNNFNNLFHRRALSLDQIKEATAPLSVFVSTFPDAKSIEGSEYLFRAHPEIEGAHGINDAGTKVINNLVRCFFIRKVDIGRLVWSERGSGSSVFGEKEEALFWERAKELSLSQASSLSTDEFLSSVRNRYIARRMDRRGLYSWGCESYVSSKDFFLCMREISPDDMNTVHHVGSTPIIVALEKNEGDELLREIIVLLSLSAYMDTLFFDDSFGDKAAPRSEVGKTKCKKAWGYFSGEYVLVHRSGALESMGRGRAGIVNMVLSYTKDHDINVYSFLVGKTTRFRPMTIEDEHRELTCF